MKNIEIFLRNFIDDQVDIGLHNSGDRHDTDGLRSVCSNIREAIRTNKREFLEEAIRVSQSQAFLSQVKEMSERRSFEDLAKTVVLLAQYVFDENYADAQALASAYKKRQPSYFSKELLPAHESFEGLEKFLFYIRSNYEPVGIR